VDREQKQVDVGSVADPGPRAAEDTATDGDAAHAEAAPPQTDPGETAQPAEQVAATAAQDALRGVGVHDDPPRL